MKLRGDDRKFLARVLSVGVDCDVAALQVDDPAFWEGVTPLELGPLPRLQVGRGLREVLGVRHTAWVQHDRWYWASLAALTGVHGCSWAAERECAGTSRASLTSCVCKPNPNQWTVRPLRCPAGWRGGGGLPHRRRHHLRHGGRGVAH